MSGGTPPNDRKVGARVRIRAEHVDAVAARFVDAGVEPIYVHHREDGDISFWFGKADAANPALIAAIQAIPLDHWAGIGIVGSPIFTPSPP